MVNNWQCFKRSLPQVAYQKKKKNPDDVFSSSRQGLRFQFLFCLSYFLIPDLSDLRRKSLPFSPSLFGIPEMEQWATTLILHPPLPPFHSLFPLTEPSDLLQHPLLSMGATLTAARTRLYRGCTQDCNLPEHTACEVGQRGKDQRGTLVTNTTPLSTQRTGCRDSLFHSLWKGLFKKATLSYSRMIISYLL